jgi:hypothetical protein
MKALKPALLQFADDILRAARDVTSADRMCVRSVNEWFGGGLAGNQAREKAADHRTIKRKRVGRVVPRAPLLKAIALSWQQEAGVPRHHSMSPARAMAGGPEIADNRAFQSSVAVPHSPGEPMPSYQHVKVPTGGQKITVNKDFSLSIPDQPIIPISKATVPGWTSRR